ncbi:MAG TPA: hypothetical protein VLE26_07660 [Alphaproteobacteria bacterium]|nr:hypothetical protein [Alphaproteobacteria bacterium]
MEVLIMNAHPHGDRGIARAGVAGTSGEPGWAGLIPATCVAYGTVEGHEERLIGLQSAVGRIVEWVATVGSRLSSLPPVRISEVFGVAGFTPTGVSNPSQRKS